MSAPNSLERVIALLDVFSEERLEWTPEEMMEELGYSRPTLYRYLKTLKQAGFLTSMPSGGFTLGPRVVEMDFLMRKSDPLVRLAQPWLEELVSAWPCNALVARWYGDKLLCVASECSTDQVESSYPRGRPMPLARGAISRSIIAFLPRRKLLPVIDDNLDDLRDVGLGNDRKEIINSLRRVRRTGYAVAYGEVTPGVAGIAAPVSDGGASPIASLCVTLAREMADSHGADAIGRRVAEVAGEIRARLSLDRAESEAVVAETA